MLCVKEPLIMDLHGSLSIAKMDPQGIVGNSSWEPLGMVPKQYAKINKIKQKTPHAWAKGIFNKCVRNQWTLVKLYEKWS